MRVKKQCHSSGSQVPITIAYNSSPDKLIEQDNKLLHLYLCHPQYESEGQCTDPQLPVCQRQSVDVHFFQSWSDWKPVGEDKLIFLIVLEQSIYKRCLLEVFGAMLCQRPQIRCLNCTWCNGPLWSVPDEIMAYRISPQTPVLTFETRRSKNQTNLLLLDDKILVQKKKFRAPTYAVQICHQQHGNDRHVQFFMRACDAILW